MKGTPEYWVIETLLKGPEVSLPAPHTFKDNNGAERSAIRVRWWLGGEGHTFHSLCMPENDAVPKLPADAAALKFEYGATEPPTFIGHYWLPPATLEPLTPNVVSVDYSVAKPGGMLAAYRWDGERVLDAAKFVTVPRVDLPPKPLVPPPVQASADKGFKVLVDDNFHHMDEDERYELGKFPTLEAAIAACRKIVDDFLASAMKQGTPAKDLYGYYVAFGEDPWVFTGDGAKHFSAWDYAKSRCDEICGK